MRFSRLVLSCSVVGTLLAAPMAAPAGAATLSHCAGNYLSWVSANVTPGSVIDADLDLVLGFWGESWNFVNCQIAEADDAPDAFEACVQATMFYRNLRSSAPLLRYTDAGVNLLGGHFSIFFENIFDDANELSNCA